MEKLLRNLFIFTTTAIFIALALTGTADAQLTSSKTRTTQKIAEGVYVIIHKDAPDTFPQGNTIVVIGEKEVLVVDSCLLPSSAKEDIADIKKWTNKPVRYLVNTHWHFDHTNGNGDYAAAFPGLIVIAQRETARMIANFNPAELLIYPGRKERFQKYLETGKDPDGLPLSDVLRKDIEVSLIGLDEVVAEFKNVVLHPADITFTDELSLDLGKRLVQIKFLGRGNTAGDTVVYLPDDKIAAVGDLLDHPVPYFFGGFPSELPATLKRIDAMDIAQIVPGHGQVLHDKTYLNMVVSLLGEVNWLIRELVEKKPGIKLEEVRQISRQRIDAAAWKKKFAGDNKENGDYFDESFDSLISVAYKEALVR